MTYNDKFKVNGKLVTYLYELEYTEEGKTFTQVFFQEGRTTGSIDKSKI